MKYADTVSLAEEYGTVSIDVSHNSGTANVVVKCPWDKTKQLVSEIMEGGEKATPKEFPRQLDGSGSRLVANSIRIEPLRSTPTADEEAIDYEYAMVTIGYTMMATEISVDSTAQYVTVNPQGLYWNINGTYEHIAPEQAPGVRISSFDMTLSHPHMKTSFEGGSLDSFAGYINQFDVFIRYNGFSFVFPAETLLFNAPSIRSGVSLFGTGFCSVTAKFSYNPIGYNRFYHPRVNGNTITDQTTRMYKAGGGTGDYSAINIYPTKDFSNLFKAFGIYTE